MTVTTSPPETLEPSEPARRKRKEIDPEHDIDAVKTILWLVLSTVTVFISLWLLLQVFSVVIFNERSAKIEIVAPEALEDLRESEDVILRGGGTGMNGIPRISIEEAMEELVGR